MSGVLKNLLNPLFKHRKFSNDAVTSSLSKSTDGIRYPCKRLGSTYVTEPQDEATTADAIRRIVHEAKATRLRPRTVVLSVTHSALTIECPTSFEVMEFYNIEKITYCSADGHYNHIFAFVTTAEKNAFECHAFLCRSSKTARAISTEIAEIFKELAQSCNEDKMRKDIDTKTLIKEMERCFLNVEESLESFREHYVNLDEIKKPTDMPHEDKQFNTENQTTLVKDNHKNTLLQSQVDSQESSFRLTDLDFSQDSEVQKENKIYSNLPKDINTVRAFEEIEKFQSSFKLPKNTNGSNSMSSSTQENTFSTNFPQNQNSNFSPNFIQNSNSNFSTNFTINENSNSPAKLWEIFSDSLNELRDLSNTQSTSHMETWAKF